MNATDIIKFRLSNQQIVNSEFKRPEEILDGLARCKPRYLQWRKWAFGLED